MFVWKCSNIAKMLFSARMSMEQHPPPLPLCRLLLSKFPTPVTKLPQILLCYMQSSWILKLTSNLAAISKSASNLLSYCHPIVTYCIFLLLQVRARFWINCSLLGQARKGTLGNLIFVVYAINMYLNPFGLSLDSYAKPRFPRRKKSHRWQKNLHHPF